MAVSGSLAAVFAVGMQRNKEVVAVGSDMFALYAAESGIGEGLSEIAASMSTNVDPVAALGTEANPRALGGSTYWVTIDPVTDELYRLTATGNHRGSERTIETIVRAQSESVFHHAVFAGNTSDDPSYTLTFGGTGTQADRITGDVFVSGDLDITGDSKVTGELLASGTIDGGTGTEGASRPTPDIGVMDYENTADYNVAELFKSASWTSDGIGGSAYQMPESSPAHILRKNPSDRTDETSGTAKDDYFLEDPYESTSSTHRVSLSGMNGNPGEDGNEKVYYIDGNLWVHNKSYLDMYFETAGEGVKITFIAKGNVYFSDNVVLDNKEKDGVAFIAIKDDGVADSGNIYLGDPRYGTLEEMNAYLYAENNFYDNNLSASGSATVTINGIMSAGNHVDIDRDYVKSDGSVQHSRLTVNFDDRVSSGDLEMPGLPGASSQDSSVTMLLWREVNREPEWFLAPHRALVRVGGYAFPGQRVERPGVERLLVRAQARDLADNFTG